MKLNLDCIRDILLAVEANTSIKDVLVYDGTKDYQFLVPYDTDEVLYHIRQCAESGFFLGIRWYDAQTWCAITDLSPDGHKFLSNIRDNGIWDKVKSRSKKIGVASLDAIVQIAGVIVSDLIKNS